MSTTNEPNDELDQREKVRRLAEEFAQDLRNAGQPDVDDFVRRIAPSLRERLREELVGEEFAYRFDDATQDGSLRYRPVAHLGRGAFAEVYKAVDEHLGRQVAIKVLRRTTDAAKQRFLSETHRQAILPKHAHLVAVYDSGVLPKGHPFVVMEYIGGGTLRKKLDCEGKLDAETAARLAEQIASAVAVVHEGTSGSRTHPKPALVHRDLKPENILLNEYGQVHVADFGLAAAAAELHAGTAGGGGTIAYMSPEQATAFRPGMTPAPIDTRSDVWALGVILYELLTGMPPFVSQAADPQARREEIVDGILRYEPQQMRGLSPEVPTELERIVGECLKKDVTERLQTAAEFAKQVRRWLDSVSAIPAPIDFHVELERLRKDFTDRPWLFDEVDVWPEHLNERLLLLVGEPGSGKSAFLAELIERNPQQRVLAWHICRHDLPMWRSPAQFIRSLAGMLAMRLESYRAALAQLDLREALRLENCQQDPASAFETAIVAPLANVARPGDGVFFIVVDALDEADLASSASIPALLAGWHRRLPEWLRIVATTRRDSVVLNLFSGVRHLIVDRDNLQHADEIGEDIERHLRTRLDQPNLAERLQQSGLSAEAVVKSLLEKSQLNYLYVAEALTDIERDLLKFQELDRLPPGLHALYCNSFRRHWPDRRRFAKVRPILEVLVAAQEPPPEQLLAYATGLDEYCLDEHLDAMAHYLDRRHDTVRLRHKAISEWLTETQGTYRVIPHKGDERLAATCWREYEQGIDTMSLYSLKHLPQHLIQANQPESLVAVATDLRFLEAKTQAGMVVGLKRNLDQTASCLQRADNRQSTQVQLLAEALAMDLSFIGMHPDSLFQCLWNRCWWHDPTKTAAHLEDNTGGISSHEGKSLCGLMERWRAERKSRSGPWLRSLRPPRVPLRSSMRSRLRGHNHPILAVAVSPVGHLAVTGDEHGWIGIWDTRSGGMRRLFPVEAEPELRCMENAHTGELVEDQISGPTRVTCLAFSPDGKTFASGHEDRSVRMWQSLDGTRVSVLPGHEAQVVTVRFDPMGRYLAGGSTDGSVVVWDVRSYDFVRFPHDDRRVLGVAFSPDGSRLVAASADGIIRLWDVENWEECRRLEVPSNWLAVANVAFSATGKLTATVGDDHVLRIWDLKSGERIAALSEPSHVYTEAVEFLPDDMHVATAGNDRTVRVWNFRQQRMLAELHGHDARVMSLACIPGESSLVSGSWDSTAIIWDITRPNMMYRLKGDEPMLNVIPSYAYINNGEFFATAGVSTIRLWDPTCGRPVAALCDDDVQRWCPNCIAQFDSESSLVAAGDEHGTVRVWQISQVCPNPISPTVFRPHRRWQAASANSSVDCIVFSPDGRQLAWGGGGEQNVFIAPVDNLTVAAECRGHSKAVRGLAFSTGGDLLASCSEDGTVRLWDSRTGSRLAGLHRMGSESRVHSEIRDRLYPLSFGEKAVHGASFLSVAISPDGRWIAAGTLKKPYSVDGIYIWDLHRIQTERVRPLELRGHTSDVDSLLFSSDSRFLASGSADNTVRIWRVATKECVSKLGARFATSDVFQPFAQRSWQRFVEKRQTCFAVRDRTDSELWLPGIPQLVPHPSNRTIWAGPDAPSTSILFFKIENE